MKRRHISALFVPKQPQQPQQLEISVQCPEKRLI
jgi:hypothetical protein